MYMYIYIYINATLFSEIKNEDFYVEKNLSLSNLVHQLV